jgi:hypothetical protein
MHIFSKRAGDGDALPTLRFIEESEPYCVSQYGAHSSPIPRNDYFCIGCERNELQCSVPTGD